MARYLLASSSTFDKTFDATFAAPGARKRGSINGVTFQRNGNTFILRTRSVPTNKRSVKQTHSRNRFSAIQQFWRMIDSLGKQSFRDEAPNYPRVDSLGNPYTISGINLQQSSNTQLYISDEPFIDEMPAPTVFPVYSAGTPAFVTSIPFIAFPLDPVIVPAGFNLMVYATRPLSPGKLSAQDSFVFLGHLVPGSNSELFNWTDRYVNTFGSIQGTEGQQIFYVLHLLSLDTGQPGMSIAASVISVP